MRFIKKGTTEVNTIGALYNLKQLKDKAISPFYTVDPLNVAIDPIIRGQELEREFDVVVYVMPRDLDPRFTGANMKEQTEETIERHAFLVDLFLVNCELIFPGGGEWGEAQIFDLAKGPHNMRPLEEIAESHGMEIDERSFPWGGQNGLPKYSLIRSMKKPLCNTQA